MREYGKIKTSFWSSRKVRVLSDDAKLLFTYLVACPHGNSIGCFVLPMGYVTEDMGWSTQKCSECIRELVSNGFIERDEGTRVTRIVSWWEHNTIENGNVARSVANLAEALPSCGVSHRTVHEILSLDNRFLSEFRTRLESVPNVSADSAPNNEPEPEPEPNQRHSEFGPNSQTLLDEQFDQIWGHVPKRVDKVETKREFKKALKDDDFTTILSRVIAWERREKGKDQQYIKSPRRWFSGKHWQDEIATPLKPRVLM